MDIPKVLHGNPEHSGISTAIPIILLLSIVVFYAVLYRLMPLWLGGEPLEFLVINGIIAVVLGLGLIAVVDPLLKRVWPSGHLLEFGDENLRYRSPENGDCLFQLVEPFKLICWKFELSGYTRFGRERQLRRGSTCYACQLYQNDAYLVVHTFISAPLGGRGESIERSEPFVKLEMDEIYDTSLTGRLQQWRLPGGRPELPSSLIVSERGPYWLAERRRWEHGIELRPADFSTFIAYVERFKSRETA